MDDVERIVARLEQTPLYEGSGEESDLGEQAANLLRKFAADDAVRAMNQSLDNAYAQLAAEAIRSSFFVSVSGEEKPYRYHLRLSYPTMEAMHAAEDNLKQFAARKRFMPLRVRAALQDFEAWRPLPAPPVSSARGG